MRMQAFFHLKLEPLRTRGGRAYDYPQPPMCSVKVLARNPRDHGEQLWLVEGDAENVRTLVKEGAVPISQQKADDLNRRWNGHLRVDYALTTGRARVAEEKELVQIESDGVQRL